MLDDDLNDVVMETIVIPNECKGPVPTIMVTSTCRYKMHALAKVVYREFKDRDGALEAYAFLLGSRMGFAEDIVIPKQEDSGALTSVDPRDVITIHPEIDAKNKEREKKNEEIRVKNAEITKKNDDTRAENALRASHGEEILPEEKLIDELKPLQIIGWTHSHNTMPAFSSGTDDANHKRIHDELVLTDLKKNAKSTATMPVPFYVIGITVNVRKEECGVIYASNPCGLTRQYTGASIDEIEEPDFTREQMESIILSILADVRKKVNIRATRYTWAPARDHERDRDHHQSTPISRTLDSYMHRVDNISGDRIINDVDNYIKNLDESASIEAIVKDKEILSKIVAIQKSCGGKDSKIYQEVKEYLRGIIETEREFVIKKARGIIKKTDSKGNGDIENFIFYEDGAPKKIKTTSDEDASETCSKCGKTLIVDGVEVDKPSGYTDDSGNPTCVGCSIQDEADENESYFDDEGMPVKCSSCKHKLIESGNYMGDEDDDGLPLCVECAPINNADAMEIGTELELDDPDIPLELNTSPAVPKDPAPEKSPGENVMQEKTDA